MLQIISKKKIKELEEENIKLKNQYNEVKIELIKVHGEFSEIAHAPTNVDMNNYKKQLMRISQKLFHLAS